MIFLNAIILIELKLRYQLKRNKKFFAYVKKLPKKNCSKDYGVENESSGINDFCDFKFQQICCFKKD